MLHILARLVKDSHFWGRFREGFALVGTALPNVRKGLFEKGRALVHFVGQNLERVRLLGKTLQRSRTFGHQLRREGSAVLGHKRHHAKKLEIKMPFLLHSAFINSSQRCIFLVGRVADHFRCKFW